MKTWAHSASFLVGYVLMPTATAILWQAESGHQIGVALHLLSMAYPAFILTRHDMIHATPANRCVPRPSPASVAALVPRSSSRSARDLSCAARRLLIQWPVAERLCGVCACSAPPALRSRTDASGSILEWLWSSTEWDRIAVGHMQHHYQPDAQNFYGLLPLCRFFVYPFCGVWEDGFEAASPAAQAGRSSKVAAKMAPWVTTVPQGYHGRTKVHF